MTVGTAVGALILTGGGSTRMGIDKAVLDWGGVRAVDRVAMTVAVAGATAIFTVGAKDHGLPHLVERPPGGGPAAAVVAGAHRLVAAGYDRALALAVDAPLIRAADIVPLLTAPAPAPCTLACTYR